MAGKNRKTGAVVLTFEPVFNELSRVLILGTIPSVQSRKEGFYYSHPRNRFWPVLAGCFDWQIPRSIEDKTKLLLENGVAVWDVLAACEIYGSDDATIRKPAYNDIAALVKDKPIEKILCNGKKAYGFCGCLDLPVPVRYVPSTSPANAAWSMERLMEVWKLEILSKEGMF